jgi:hypothetical protein
MTPLQAAKAHCDNYQQDGSCLGIASRGDLSMYRFRKEGLPCLLCSGERCSYFEEIIVPMRPELPGQAKSLASAVNAYQRKHQLQSLVRFCSESDETPLLARQRLCANCRTQHRRETHQRYNSSRTGRNEPLKYDS